MQNAAILNMSDWTKKTIQEQQEQSEKTFKDAETAKRYIQSNFRKILESDNILFGQNIPCLNPECNGTHMGYSSRENKLLCPDCDTKLDAFNYIKIKYKLQEKMSQINKGCKLLGAKLEISAEKKSEEMPEIQKQGKTTERELFLEQLKKMPIPEKPITQYFFIVSKRNLSIMLRNIGACAVFISKAFDTVEFLDTLQTLDAGSTQSASYIFCPCLDVTKENLLITGILENECLKCSNDSWKLFKGKTYLNDPTNLKLVEEVVDEFVQRNEKHDIDNETNFINAPIQLKCGEWIGDESGIYKWTIEKKTGQPYKIFAAKQQILLSGIIEDVETKEQQYCLSFSSKRQNNYIWKTIYTDPVICSSKTKIINLANNGIRVTDQTAPQLVSYIDDLRTLNEENIPVKESIRHLGWIENRFFPYEQEIIFSGDTRQKEVVDAIHEQGDFQVWQQNFQEFRKNLIFRLVTDTCFASVLIEKIGGLCFLLHLWGGTGKGKTVGLKAAASIWGEPEKLLLSADVTDNYATGRASFFKNLPVLVDETQVANNRIDRFIYLLTEGHTRGRLDRNGKERNASTWTCATILTGEKPLINGKSAAGAANRVIELEVEDSLFKDFGQVMDIIQENYGGAGKRFVEYIQQQDIKELRQEYNQIQKEIRTLSDATGKQAASLAFIILADRIANKCIFGNEKSLQIDNLISVLKTETEVSQSERAYDFIIDWIATNQKCFILNESDPMPIKTLGKIEKGFCYFNQSELIEVLSKNNFDFDAIKKDWSIKGYLEKNSQGRYFHYTKVRSIKAQYTKIKLPEEKAEFQNINQENVPFKK